MVKEFLGRVCGEIIVANARKFVSWICKLKIFNTIYIIQTTYCVIMADFKHLLDDIVNNPDQLDELSLDELVEMQKQLDPLGHTSYSGDKKYMNISIINFREEYLKKMLGTSLIGFIYRQLEEYDPLKDADIKRTLEKDRKNLLDVYHNDVTDTVNTTVPVNDAECAQSDVELPLTRQSVRDASELPDNDDDNTPSPYVDDIGMTAEEQRAKSAEIRGYVKSFLDQIFEFDPDRHVRGAIDAVDKTKEGWSQKLREQLLTKLGEETNAAVIVEPPADMFHNWGRYADNHYEEFVELTAALYLEKPDIEYAINFYDSFGSLEEAEQHIRNHQDNVIAPILTIENGAWTYLSSRRENREKISYDNKDTELLRRMTEKVKQDQSLGKDMMQKRVKYEKKKNILREGPDSKGLEKYKGAVSTIASLGAKEGLSKEERERLQAAYYEKEMAEVPDDAIQVDVWGPDKQGNVSRSKFYTKAEAPDYLLEAQRTQQQISGNNGGKVLTSRTGAKATVSDVAQLSKE